MHFISSFVSLNLLFAMPAESIVNLLRHEEASNSSKVEGRKYHTSAQIFAEIKDLQKNCAVPLTTEWVNDIEQPENALFVAKLGQKSANKTMMVAANEHAREMITGEVAFRFIERACERASPVSQMQDLQFLVMPVINVKGRELVESGEHECQRMTTHAEGDTDLNRNMDVDWGKGRKQKWGSKPFSAYQTRIMRDIASSEKPVAYVDLHSGAKSLMSPWGFQPAVSNHYNEQKVPLEEVQKNHCHDCQMGSNRVVIGYPNPGEIIDHMYKQQGIKHSSLWEVWEGDGPYCSGFNPPVGLLAKSVDNWSDALVTYAHHVHNHLDPAEDRVDPSLIEVPQISSLLDMDTVASTSVFEARLTS
jgi:hypothetical protein